MATIHLMVGFIGFGKTTIAKTLEKNLKAVRFTHDEFMRSRYGRNPDDFQSKYITIDNEIRQNTKQIIKNGQDVILDYGFWTSVKRKEYYEWAKSLTDSVIFHNVYCDMNIAKQRIMERSQTDISALLIDENTFDMLAKQYEPWNALDNYPVILHNFPISCYIGKQVPIKIDRPLGSLHPKYGFKYPINYGFVPFTQSGDGEELDAYVLEVGEALEEYVGQCIGVIHRTNDEDDKLIIVPQNIDLTNNDIEKETAFQEKWFEHVLIRS